MTAVIAGSNGKEVDLKKLTNYMDAEPEESTGEFQSPNAVAASMAQMYPRLIK